MQGLKLCCAFVAFWSALSMGQSVQAQLSAAEIAAGLTASPAEGGARRWQVQRSAGLTLKRVPGGGQEVGNMLSEAAVVQNFGCAETNGSLWCKVRPLHGGPQGFASSADLAPIAGPDGVIARGMNDSAKRAKRKRFDATAVIQCAQEAGEALGPCPVGVSRSDGGDVTAAVTFKTGFTRLLFFMHGEFISAAATMSGAGRDTDWQVVEDVHLIRADDQRFEIPNEVLFGQP
ncbi:MAG: hypothetical protein AAF943_06320 [Pseudomonadota bacterium]